MLRLMQLEFLKLRPNRALWWLLGLYALALIGISMSGGVILQKLADNGVSYNSIDPTILPIYDFDDIWQNLAYLGYFFKIFPAFLIIISITNEFSFKTHRQNIIDGLSKSEFFFSKLSFAGFLAILSGILVLILGLVLGSMYSDVKGINYIVKNIIFVPVHVLQLFIYFLAAMFLALLIRKSGITIVLFLLYTVILEPIISLIISEGLGFTPDFLPLECISSLIHFPFPKYIFMPIQDFVSIVDLLKAIIWCAVFIFGISWQLRKRDF